MADKSSTGTRRARGVSADRDMARAGVPEIQRARIVAALVEVARERGAGRVTVAHVVERSGVSRRTFYEQFEDRDACFVAAFEEAIERAAGRVVPAFHRGEQRLQNARAWRERMRTALLALLEFLDEEPDLGGLCVVDTLGAGPGVLEARARVVSVLVDVVEEGGAVSGGASRPSRLTAEGVVGGVLAVLYARIAAGDPRPLVELLNPLMGMIALPYLGSVAAARELARAAPKARPRSGFPRSNPLEGLGMRLTYRTVRVLVAIAACEGASNRRVADAAGVADQGQISKLLSRLEHLGLIENAGAGTTRGEPNAWRLTARGREVELAIGRQTAPAAG